MSEKISIQELMNQYNYAKESLKTAEEMLSYNFQFTYGLSFKKLESSLVNYISTGVNDNNFNDIIEIINNCIVDKDSYNSFKNDGFTEESINRFFEDFKKEHNDLKELQDSIKEIEESINKTNEEYFDYINSDEYRQKKKEQIDGLKEKVENLSGIEKMRCEELIKITEHCVNGDSILYRIVNSDGSINKGEVNSITRAFFDVNASKTIMNKFNNKCIKLGIDTTAYRSLFNVEEIVSNTTGEDLYCYNNIILFTWMRMVAYSDPENKNDNFLISECMKLLLKVVHNKYPSAEDQQHTADIVKKFCSIFDSCGYRDKFIQHNKLSPNHEERKKLDKERKENYRIEYNECVENWNNKCDEDSKMESMNENDVEEMSVMQVYSKLCNIKEKIDNLNK